MFLKSCGSVTAFGSVSRTRSGAAAAAGAAALMVERPAEDIQLPQVVVTDTRVPDRVRQALDVESGGVVLRTLKELSREDRAVVLVTHDPRVFPYADRLIQMEDGRVDTDTGRRVER